MEGEEAAEGATVDAGTEGGERAESERGEEDEDGELDAGLTALLSRAPPAEGDQGDCGAEQPGERHQGLPEAEGVAGEEAGGRAAGEPAPEDGRDGVHPGEHPQSSRR